MKVSQAFESKEFDIWIGRSGGEPGPGHIQGGSLAADSGDSVSAVVETPPGSESSSAVVEPWRHEPERLPAVSGGEEELSEGRRRTWLLIIAAVLIVLTAFALGIVVGSYGILPVTSS